MTLVVAHMDNMEDLICYQPGVKDLVRTFVSEKYLQLNIAKTEVLCGNYYCTQLLKPLLNQGEQV